MKSRWLAPTSPLSLTASPLFFSQDPGSSFINYETGNLRKAYTHSEIHIQPVKREREDERQGKKRGRVGEWEGFCRVKLYYTFFAAPRSTSLAPPQTTLRAQRRKCVVKYLTWSIPPPTPPLPVSPEPLPPPLHPSRDRLSRSSVVPSPHPRPSFLPPLGPAVAGSIASYEHPVFCIIKYATPTSRYSDFMGSP